MLRTQMKLVDHIYYINLDHREDRLEHILQEITKIPPWVYGEDPTVITRFSAIKHERGFIGRAMSHLAVMKDAREKDYQNVMILEDDATFVESSTEINSYFTAISEYLATGAEWDLFFVIANIWSAQVIKGHMERHKIIHVKNGQAGACYIVNRDYYNLLIANMDDCVQNGKHLDMHWKALQYYHKWYAVYPSIGTQYISYSDIEKYEVNYSKYYNKKYILTYCPELTGNLGQQLFQIFSIYGLAKRYYRDFIIDKRHVKDANPDYEKFYINYRRTEDDGLLQGYIKHCYENPFFFNRQLKFTGLEEESANVLFHGLFQSKEYFSEYCEEIRNMFAFKRENVYYNIDMENTAFIYIDNGSDIKEINQFIEKNDKNTKYIIIYDIEYDCKYDGQEFIKNAETIVEKDEKESVKLEIMALCEKGGIGGNTTLSWWGIHMNCNEKSLRTKSLMPTIPKPRISVILNAYKRIHHLDEQIICIINQTIKPCEIIIWNNSEKNIDYFIQKYPEIPIYIFTSSKNMGVWPRFFASYNASGNYLAIFDDDTIPGKKWFENCLQSMSIKEGLYGTTGYRFGNDKYFSNNVQRIGWAEGNDNIEEVDIIGHAWFLKKDWMKYFTNDLPDINEYNLMGEDLHLSYTLLKYGNIHSYISPQPRSNIDLYGSIKGWQYGCENIAISKQPESSEKFEKAYIHWVKTLGHKLYNYK